MILYLIQRKERISGIGFTAIYSHKNEYDLFQIKLNNMKWYLLLLDEWLVFGWVSRQTPRLTCRNQVQHDQIFQGKNVFIY